MNQASNGSADGAVAGQTGEASTQIKHTTKPLSVASNDNSIGDSVGPMQPQPIFVNTLSKEKFPAQAQQSSNTAGLKSDQKVPVRPREFILGEESNRRRDAEGGKRRKGHQSPPARQKLSQPNLIEHQLQIQNSQSSLIAGGDSILPQTVPIASTPQNAQQQYRAATGRKSTSQRQDPSLNTAAVYVLAEADQRLESAFDSQKLIVDLQSFALAMPQETREAGYLSERKPSLGAFGKRNQSQVVNSMSNRKSSLQSPFQQLKHDQTINEIKQNQFQTVSRIMEPYLKEKPTAQTVSNLEEQMRVRVLPHSYATLKKQKESIQPSELRRQAGGLAVRTIINNSQLYIRDPSKKEEIEEDFARRLLEGQVGRFVEAKKQVQMPKDLVLMKIAQRQIEEQKRQFAQEVQLTQALARSSADGMLTSSRHRRGSSLPMIIRNSEARINKDEHLNQDSSVNLINQSQKHAGLLKLLHSQSEVEQSSNALASTTIQDGTAVGFHITDLLKQVTGQPKMSSGLKATLEFYQRALKDNEMLKVNKEIIIKNYRLRVVDGHKDITPEDRKLMHKNPGTSIYVANSLIKPEIYRYSTKVSNAMQEVFIDMVARSHSTRRQSQQKRLPSTQQFDALTFDNESEMYQHHESRQQDTTPRHDPQAVESDVPQAQEVPSTARKVTPFTPNTGASAKQKARTDSKGVSSSGIYYEQYELQAMQVASQMINLWFDSVGGEYDKTLGVYQQQIYEMINSNANRYVLMNGQFAPLTHKEIAQRMVGAKQTQLTLQPRVIPNEDMTAITRIVEKPYLHLMRSTVVPELKEFLAEFNRKTAKYVDPSTLLKSHQNPVVQVVDYEQQRDAFAVVRVEFTHLDPHPIQAINLSQDLFFEEYLVDDLISLLEKGGETVHAQTEFMFVQMGGQYALELIDVEVLSYSPQTRWFHIVNRELKVDTYRSRFNLKLDTDADNFLEENRELIDFWKEHSSQFLKLQRLIEAEMSRRYDYLQFNDDSRKRILRMVGDLGGYERRIVERVIVQIEALYVFSLLKSALASQRKDPFVKNMLQNFKVEQDSPALEVKMSAFKVKEDLHEGIYAFRFNAIKNQLQRSSLSMSNAKYMALPKMLAAQTRVCVIDKLDQLFITPIPARMLIDFGDKSFVSMLPNEIDKEVNTYPLQHQRWITAQKVIQEQFQKMLKVSWAETLAEKIYQFIKGDFVFDTVLDFTEDQIDPNLVKILAQIKQYQATTLYEVFERGLREYMRFLLGFAMRNPEIKQSKIVGTIRQADQMRLINEDPNFVQPADQDINDLDLIPLKLKPFIRLRSEIQITGKIRNRKYKVITVPELDEIHRDLFSVVRNIHGATRELCRAENILFPKLQLDNKYVSQPDLKNNAKITYILKLFDKLIGQSMIGCKNKVGQFQGYLTIFEKKVDGIILELKKQSFALANEASESEEDEAENLMESILESDVALEADRALAKHKSSTKVVGDDDSFGVAENDDAADSDSTNGEGGQQGNMMAYKSVEIDQNLMRAELELVRNHRYAVLNECFNEYDFGVLWMDCTPYKQLLVSHCEALESEIEQYLRGEFLEKMRNVTNEINALKGRLDENVSSIDDVIALLNYIDSLKRQDNKVEEIADFIDIMTKQIQFIDSLSVSFPVETRIEFWNMRNWPRIFDKWIKERREQLLNQKEKLIEQMHIECDNVKEMVEDFKRNIKEMLKKGLRTLNDDQAKEREVQLKALFVAMLPENQTGLVPVEIPREVIFDWLASETKWYRRRFDTTTVVKFFGILNDLKQKFDDLDHLTVQINRRQQLLGIEKTEFKEAKLIMEDLKPLYDLWCVADGFREYVCQWFEDSLSQVDAAEVESKIEEWQIEIKRLQKSPIVLNNSKQQEVLSFLLDSIFYINKYLLLIKTVRVKGLTARHWRQINSELGIQIDPVATCIMRLIGMNLQSDENLQKIKLISDVAQKEFAIQMQTEALEREVKVVEFEFSSVIQGTDSLRSVRKIDAVVTKFNEFQLRVQVLKMNPYMRNFFERLLDIEKIIKQAVEIVSEFTGFQAKWQYLYGVFVGESLATSLAYEMKIWKNVDRFYKQQVRAMWETPHVWRVSQREGVLANLRKMTTEIDQCRAGLAKFLEMKRQLFPRLYFIQNEELLKIYGRHQAIIEEMASGHDHSFITRVYQGVHRLVFNKQLCVIGVEAVDGERVMIDTPIRTSLQLEVWLKNLDRALNTEIRYQILLSYMAMDIDIPQAPEDLKELREYKKMNKFQIRRVNKHDLYEWIAKWTGQATYMCQQLWLTQKIHQVFDGALLKAKYIDQVNRQRAVVANIGGQPGMQQPQSDSSDSEVDIYQLSDEESGDEDDHIVEQAPVNLQADSSQERSSSQDLKPSDSTQGSTTITNQKQQRSRLAVHERAMRFWSRFCPNDIQHPHDVLADIKNSVLQKIQFMTAHLNQQLPAHEYNSTVSLITFAIHQRDQLQEMMDTKQYKATDYAWEIQFKFYIDKLTGVFKSVLPMNLEQKQHVWLELLDPQELEVRFQLFHIERKYGFEYLGNAQRLVITPLTARAQRAMFLAMQFQFASAVEGPFGTGKTETVKDLCHSVAQPIYVVNPSTQLNLDEILKFMKGVTQCGFSVLVDEFNRMSSAQLSFMIQLITQVQNAIRGQVRLIHIDEDKVNIDLNAGIFITMNPGYTGRVELPVNLKNLFRPVQMVVPDWQLITESLLARAGFCRAHELSKKISHVQKLANEMMQRHSHVQKDFGLRAIQAIVSIAEILKQQCQNLRNSDLPDFINGHTMTVLNWRDQQLINDVIAELNSDDVSQSQPSLQFGGTSQTYSGKPLIPKDPSVQTIDRQDQQQLIASTESLPVQKNRGGDEDREQSQKPASKFVGPFFDAAFYSDLSREQRQRLALLSQIGVTNDEPSDEALEEFIIIKAIKDFNNSKFYREDHAIINQLIVDVFSGDNGERPQNDAPPNVASHQSNYGNLRELIQQYMHDSMLDHSGKMEQLCYQFFEVTQVKTGCIVLGETQSAKTTMIETLSGALNFASLNELKLRVAHIRKERLKNAVFASPMVAQLLPAPVIKRYANQIRQAQKGTASFTGSQTSSLNLAATQHSGSASLTKPKKQKLTEKQKMAMWLDLYQKTKLDRLQIFKLEQELVIRGVRTKRVNPKAIDKHHLLGYVDGTSGVWTEGQLTAIVREFAEERSTFKNWVHIDGPLDHEWAENLNSALDENRELNLANGEIIKIAPTTCFIFEAESLKNLTPATVSRCGLVHMSRAECNSPKYILNQYFNRLPPNVQDNIKDLDQQINWLMPTCLRIFEEERQRGSLVIPSVDQFWLIQNIVKVFDSFMSSYWIDFINQNKSDWEDAPQQIALKHCTYAHGYAEDHNDIVALAQEDITKLNPDQLECRFRAMKIISVTSKLGGDGETRMAVNDFVSNETRLENSLKFMPLWMEAFFMTAIASAFRSILSLKAQQRLSDALKGKYEERKGDFSTYQKQKKKQLQAREELKKKEQKALLKAMMNKTGQASEMFSTQKSLEQKMQETQKAKANLIQSVKTMSTLSGLTTEFKEATNEAQKPMFITDFPFTNEHGLNMFDYYFSLDNSQWVRFDTSDYQVRMQQVYNKLPLAMQSTCNIVVPTMSLVKDFYTMECLLIAQKPFMVMGERASGKSTVVKDMLFQQTSVFCDRLLADHIGCTWRTDANSFKQQLTKYLRIVKTVKVRPSTDESEAKHPVEDTIFETDSDASRGEEQPATAVADDAEGTKQDEDAKSNKTSDVQKALLDELNKQIRRERPSKKLRPHAANVSLAIYLEDLHLSSVDSFHDNSTAESVRDLIAYRQYYATNKHQIRQIESVNIVSCVNISRSQISQRVIRHFAPIGIQLLDEETSVTVVHRILEMFSGQWHIYAQQNLKQICSAMFELYKHCYEQLRPTPIKVQYTFNQREMYKMITSFCKVESSYVKDSQSLCKLFYHEAMRQYGDRILMKHDYKWLTNAVKAICCKHLVKSERDDSKYDFGKLAENNLEFSGFPVEEPDNLWFSVLNQDVEGYYFEVKTLKQTESQVLRQIERYNEQQDVKKLSLVLFDDLFQYLFKILRAINTHSGHLIIVGLRGFAINELIKLSSFILQKALTTLEMHPDFNDQDWKQSLRSKIISTSQDDKQTCFLIEEYRMVNPNWYRDIETLMTNQIVTDCMLESDLPSIMTALKLQSRRHARQQASKIEGNLDVQVIKDNKNSLDKKTTSQQPREEVTAVTLQTILKENLKEVQKNPSISNELYQTVLKRVRKNLHFLLTFTPSGQNFRDKMQAHSQLMLNSSLIWVQQMQVNDLQQIGEKVFLDELQSEKHQQLVQDIERDPRLDDELLKQQRAECSQILKAFIQVYLITIEFAELYFESHEHRLYFTPMFFLRSMTTYRRLLKERKRNVTDTISRFDSGLNTISESKIAVEMYRSQLIEKIPQLVKQNEKVVAIIVELQSQIDHLTHLRDSSLAEEKDGAEHSTAAKQALVEAQYQMDSLVPALNNSLRTMQKISKLEIAEIRHMLHPPPLVKLVMKAVCILLDVEPLMKIGKSGKPKPSYWRAAISPQVLADPNFAERLEKFDRSNVSVEKMTIIEELMSDPDYNQESIKKSSFAAENLYNWVKALRDYYYILKELEPRKQAIKMAEEAYTQASNDNSVQKQQIKGLNSQLETLYSLLGEKTELAAQLKQEIKDKTARRRRADAILRSLNAEKQKWVVGSRMLLNTNEKVLGDVVLAAALITYGGGFSYSYRRQLVDKWQRLALKTENLATTPNFQIQVLFGDNLQIRDWHNNGLPKDVLSTDNAIIMEKTTQYITCIDPQQQASVWLKSQHAATGMIITTLQDANIRKTLEIAIEMGKLVLVEDILDKVDIHIESLVKQEISKFEETQFIKFCRKQFKLDKGFGLFLITNLPRPHFDVNLTNYSTMVNFYVTVEGLSQNLLDLIVANERSDLELNYKNSLDETFKSVKDLKKIEEELLRKLKIEDAQTLLADDQGIEMLHDSAKNSESIATHLRRIQQTSEFLEKARSVYTPIAFRAATLYRGIQELAQINPMYKYSLKWFMRQFSQMLGLVNQLNKPPSKDKQNKIPHTVVIKEEEFVLKDFSTSPEFRVDLLMKTFTQEILRKVIFSVFQQDRQVVTYFLTLKIIQAEQLSSDELLSFAIAGSRQVTSNSDHSAVKKELAWLTPVMWSDLKSLETIQPFNSSNLTANFIENPQKWERIFQADCLDFSQLPNQKQIDLDQFREVDIRDAIDLVYSKIQVYLKDPRDQPEKPSFKVEVPNTPPKAKERQKVYTELEILNDETIWEVSDDEDSSSFYDQKVRNQAFYQDDKAISDEEKVMARFMVERAPGSIQRVGPDNHRLMTRMERKNYETRQSILKRTVEFAVARCIRPDLIQACLHQLTGTIYDFKYTGFNNEILAQFIDQSGTLALRPGQKFLTLPRKENIENNIQKLIEEAYSDSSCHVPIMFLVSASINVQEELATFHAKTLSGIKYHQVQCGKGLESQLIQNLKTAVINGDWILVQNLHLEQSWVTLISQQISNLGADTHPKFRLWLTTPQYDEMDEILLKQCVKVALQQPLNIKMKIEQHLMTLKEGIFRRGQESGIYHKNVFMGLSYLHGVLEGRRNYGSLGWNVVYEFDRNDFDISDMVLNVYLKKDFETKLEALQVMKYIFANINFAGKISRSEDQRKLQAHVDDLFNERITLAYETEKDMSQSHFGMPSKDADLLYLVSNEFPQWDHYEIFGFNRNIYRQNSRREGASIISQLKTLNQSLLEEQGFADVHVSLANQLQRFTLQRYGECENVETAGSFVDNLIQLQKHLASSSLDQTIRTDGDRYDQRVESETLVLRDKYDVKVVQLAKDMLRQLEELMLPFQNEKCIVCPVEFTLNKEVRQYQNLLSTIAKSVQEFLHYLRGDGVIPFQTEQLWLKIQNNQIPDTWLSASYDTAHKSLACYIADLLAKVESWNSLITQKLKTRVYNIATFYNPRQLILAHLQKNARERHRSLTSLKQLIQVTSWHDVHEAQKHLKEGEVLLHGLWIEGADWDTNQNLLVEQSSYTVQKHFPVLKLSQLPAAQQQIIYDEEFHQFPEDNPPLTKQERKQKRRQLTQKNPSSKMVSAATTPCKPNVYTYKCPVFATTNRLSFGGVEQENKPLFYVDLPTTQKPRKWVKRAVALLLEPSVLE